MRKNGVVERQINILVNSWNQLVNSSFNNNDKEFSIIKGEVMDMFIKEYDYNTLSLAMSALLNSEDKFGQVTKFKRLKDGTSFVSFFNAIFAEKVKTEFSRSRKVDKKENTTRRLIKTLLWDNFC